MSLSSLESAHYAYLAHIGPLDARAWKGRCFPAFAPVLFQLVWCCVADSELGLYIPNTPFSKRSHTKFLIERTKLWYVYPPTMGCVKQANPRPSPGHVTAEISEPGTHVTDPCWIFTPHFQRCRSRSRCLRWSLFMAHDHHVQRTP
jgi:hypothetical protein